MQVTNKNTVENEAQEKDTLAFFDKVAKVQSSLERDEAESNLDSPVTWSQWSGDSCSGEDEDNSINPISP